MFCLNIYHLMNIDDSADPTLFLINYHTIDASSFTSDQQFAKQFYDIADFTGIEPANQITKAVASGTATLREFAKVVRSKNSGPFELTFDVMFNEPSVFGRVRKANPLTNEVMMKAYQLKNESDVLVNMYFESALAWKCTIRRPWEQGTVGETDTLGIV